MFKRFWWMLLVMAPVGMMAGLMLAAVVTYVMPRKYESFAIIEVRNRSMVREGNGESMYLQIQTTDFEVIKSRNTLSKVIDSLDLTTRWGVDRETALKILREIVEAESIGGTDLVEIRVRHTNKEDARDIVAEVARTYKESSDEQQSELMKKGILELRKAVREQEDLVKERRKKLTTKWGAKDLLSRDESLERSMDETDLVDAIRDYDELKLKLMREDIIQSLPNETIVIHDDPVIADFPISPNVTLNLVAGTFGGLLLSPFLALPLMAFMNRKPFAAA